MVDKVVEKLEKPPPSRYFPRSILAGNFHGDLSRDLPRENNKDRAGRKRL